MPKAQSITLVVGTESYVYSPVNIQNGVATFKLQGANSFTDVSTLTAGIRAVSSGQQTRKSTLQLADSLVTEPAEGCCGPSESRGTERAGVEFTWPNASTSAERADRKSTRLNSSHSAKSRMPSSA